MDIPFHCLAISRALMCVICLNQRMFNTTYKISNVIWSFALRPEAFFLIRERFSKWSVPIHNFSLFFPKTGDSIADSPLEQEKTSDNTIDDTNVSVS